MNKLSDSIISSLTDALASMPCEYAEARFSAGESTGIVLSGGDVDSLSTGEFAGGSLRALMGGRWYFCSFNDPGRIRDSAVLLRSLNSVAPDAGDSAVAACPALNERRETKCLRDPSKVSLEEKFALLHRYNMILREPASVQTTRAVYQDRRSVSAYVNSEGSRVLHERSFCGVSLTSIAKDGTVIQPFGDSVAGCGGFEIVEGREEMAERVVRTSVDLLRAEPVGGGTFDIVVDQKLAGVFIHEAFGHLSEADFVYENERMKKLMVIGKRVGPEGLNVIDDGSLQGLPGCVTIDDEGVRGDKTYLIRNGVLSGRLHSRETARRMGEAPTGNARAISVMSEPIVRMTNTYIENGPHGLEEMMEALGDGLYVADALGGQTNLEMFTFSPAYAVEVRGGKTGRLMKDVVLSGNVFSTLDGISMIGNDRTMHGGLGGCGKKGQGPLPVSFGGPHMLVRGVLIGGRQR